MREVDRLMTEEVGISLLQMMENAGRCLATQARRMLGGDMRGRRMAVLAGRGGNGGGGPAADRRLAVGVAAAALGVLQPFSELTAGSPPQPTTLEWRGIT